MTTPINLTEKERELYLALIEAHETIDDQRDFIKALSKQYADLQDDKIRLELLLEQKDTEMVSILSKGIKD